MKYATALALSEIAFESAPVSPSADDLALVARFNPGFEADELADLYPDVYVADGFRLICGDGSGYLVNDHRVFFIPSEADDDETLNEAPL